MKCSLNFTLFVMTIFISSLNVTSYKNLIFLIFYGTSVNAGAIFE